MTVKNKVAKTKTKTNKVKIVVIGSGEAFDHGLGNTSYLFEGRHYPTILFDCGYQIPERLWAKQMHTKIDAVCFTHLHADHSFGIVPLLVRFWEEGRTEGLTIFGPRGTESFIKKILNLGYPGIAKKFQYPIQFIIFDTKKPTLWKGLRFSVAATIHSILNYTIRVDFASKRSFSISGDGQITEATMMLTSDVSLHFQEVYSLMPEISVHADFEKVIQWGMNSKIKALVLSHFSREMKKVLSRKTLLSSKNCKLQLKSAVPGQVYFV